MNTIGTPHFCPGVLTTSLDVALTYIYKYSENHVVSGAVSRLYEDIKEAFKRDYEIDRVHVEMLHYDPTRRAHLLLIWGHVPNEPRIISATYYLYRRGIEGPFTLMRCVRAIGVAS